MVVFFVDDDVWFRGFGRGERDVWRCNDGEGERTTERERERWQEEDEDEKTGGDEVVGASAFREMDEEE